MTMAGHVLSEWKRHLLNSTLVVIKFDNTGEDPVTRHFFSSWLILSQQLLKQRVRQLFFPWPILSQQQRVI